MDKQRLIYNLKKNRVVRIISFPMEYINRSRMLRKYRKSKDSEYMRSLKDIHKGKRCFIVGNGPSLRQEDLDQIAGEISFGSNRIYHIYPKTKWRPTYYVSMDSEVIMAEIDNIKNIGNYPKFINYRGSKYGRKLEENLWYILVNGKFRLNPHRLRLDTLSEDCSCWVSQVGTVTVNAIEMAIYMGCTEIYLLGVDHNYAQKRGKDGKVYRDESVRSSYFEGMKDAKGKSGDGLSIQNVEAMEISYRVSRKFAEEHGVKIYNATRGGKLEIFERRDFDSIPF